MYSERIIFFKDSQCQIVETFWVYQRKVTIVYQKYDCFSAKPNYKKVAPFQPFFDKSAKSSAPHNYFRPILCFAAEISAPWQHWSELFGLVISRHFPHSAQLKQRSIRNNLLCISMRRSWIMQKYNSIAQNVTHVYKWEVNMTKGVPLFFITSQ
jgi:hypothetical protein